MLVLGRKINQIIDITTASGDKIEITIADIRGDKCRIGIEADKAVTVHRREISEKIQALETEVVE